MPRKSGYAAATKSAILEAVTKARKAGKKWKLAHEAAKGAGYKGRLGGLVQLVRNAGKGAKRQRHAVKVEKVAVVGGIGDIASVIEGLVKGRVNEALDRAVAALRESRK